jgi:hypothetical protein
LTLIPRNSLEGERGQVRHDHQSARSIPFEGYPPLTSNFLIDERTDLAPLLRLAIEAFDRLRCEGAIGFAVTVNSPSKALTLRKLVSPRRLAM